LGQTPKGQPLESDYFFILFINDVIRCPLNRKSVILYPNTAKAINNPPVGRTRRVFPKISADLTEA